MATGELVQSDTQSEHAEAPGGSAELARSEDLPAGTVVTGSGRTSAAVMVTEQPEPVPVFSGVQLARLDEALTLVSRHTRLRFSIYLGDLGADPHARTGELFDQLGEAGDDSVLIAVDPGHRNVEIMTGPEARVRLADRGCKLAVMSMVASFKEGDLHGGLLSGLQMLSEQAGRPDE
jgi:hypothetical protein